VPGPVPLPVQVVPGMPGPVVGGGDVRDPQVNAEESAWVGPGRFGDVAGGVQEPFAGPVHQVRLALAVLAEPGQLRRGACERHGPQSPGRGPDRHGAAVELPG